MCGMVRQHLHHRTRFFVRGIAAGTARRSRFPRCESNFYLGDGIDHPRDSLRMLTRANEVVETRDVAWETAPVMVPAVQLEQPASPELGGAPELGGTSEPGGASELGDSGAGRAR